MLHEKKVGLVVKRKVYLSLQNKSKDSQSCDAANDQSLLQQSKFLHTDLTVCKKLPRSS